jgi:glycosyltransferase involved in cell wall biosynthesis
VATTPPAAAPAAGPAFEIVIPARNEAGRLPEGLAALCRKAATLPLRTAVLVVDSASTDATSHVVRSWAADPVPVRLVRCQQAGKGIAVRAGLLATQAPFVGYCDADMATDLSALDTALRLLAAGAGVVIGSRALGASVVEHRRSAARRVGAATFRTLARGIVPGVTDTQCGFKFFSGPLARAAALPLRTAGFAFDIELIANCLRLGATLTEIPVRWRDVPGSSFSVWRHSVGSFGDIASIWLRSRGRLASPPPAGPALLGPPPAGFGRYVTLTGHDHHRRPERHEADQVSRTRYSYVSGSPTVSVRE